MNKILNKSLCISFLIMLIGTVSQVAWSTDSPSVSLRVEPMPLEIPYPPWWSITGATGENVTIDITIRDASSVYSFEFKLGYSTTILNAAKVDIAPFLNEPINITKSEIDNQNGIVWLNVTSTSPAEPKNGNGTLASITFQVIGLGETELNLHDDKLRDQNGDEITHITIDGHLIGVRTKLRIDPRKITAAVGDSFTVNITLADVEDLYGWEFKLGYNNSLLDATDFIEGPFLKNFGETYVVYKQIHETAGFAWGAVTLYASPSLASGTGTLASITFTAVAAGESTLNLHDTKLANPQGERILHGPVDGTVAITPSQSGFELPIGLIVALVVVGFFGVLIIDYLRKKFF